MASGFASIRPFELGDGFQSHAVTLLQSVGKVSPVRIDRLELDALRRINGSSDNVDSDQRLHCDKKLRIARKIIPGFVEMSLFSTDC